MTAVPKDVSLGLTKWTLIFSVETNPLVYQVDLLGCVYSRFTRVGSSPQPVNYRPAAHRPANGANGSAMDCIRSSKTESLFLTDANGISPWSSRTPASRSVSNTSAHGLAADSPSSL